MTRLKVKKGDTVLVAIGKDRGKRGKVLRAYPREAKILVEGVNEKVRHVRPRKAGEKGQRLRVFHPIRVSNVRVICPSCAKVTRIGYRDHVRICKKCKAELS